MNKKRTVKEILAKYYRQIKKDIGFWIKYRPSRWFFLLPEKSRKPLITFIDRKGGMKFIIKLALLFSLIFIGLIPTLNFIWSNIFRVWLIVFVIPLIYWGLAIAIVYVRVITLAVGEFVRVVLDNLID